MDSKVPTERAAEVVGIDRITLQRWIRAGKVKAPKPILRNGRGVRLWSPADIERLRTVKGQIHRKGRGRKPKPKR
jgi:predicted site-specific integrase-resolvase